MIQAGHWTGHYSFSNAEINRIRGFERTNFDLDILTITAHEFTGTIRDDVATGGTAGIGELTGQVHGNKIEFVKTMPVMTILVDRQGTRKTLNKKHRPIYYTGQLSNDSRTASGTWRFKFGFVWFGLIPIPMRPSKGIWQMTRSAAV